MSAKIQFSESRLFSRGRIWTRTMLREEGEREEDSVERRRSEEEEEGRKRRRRRRKVYSRLTQ